jgi:hypothetical protein
MGIMKTANKTKKLDNIQEFMNAWKSYDYHRVHLEPNRWQRRFQEAGYFSVALSRNATNAIDKEVVVNWCTENFENRFAWVVDSYVFWFETDKDAMLFSLRWV